MTVVPIYLELYLPLLSIDPWENFSIYQYAEALLSGLHAFTAELIPRLFASHLWPRFLEIKISGPDARAFPRDRSRY